MFKKYHGFKIIFALIFIFTASPEFSGSGAAETENDEPIISLNSSNLQDKISYYQYMLEHQNALKPNDKIIIPASDFLPIAEDDNSIFLLSDYEGETDCLIWQGEGGRISYEIEVRYSGLYNLEILYHPKSGENSVSEFFSNEKIEFGLMIDNEYPYTTASSFNLERLWQNETPIKKDNRDNELLPKQIRYNKWMDAALKDTTGLMDEAGFFYLSKGKHTITFVGIEVFAAFKSFVFKNYPSLNSYEKEKPTEEEINKTPPLTTINEIGTATILLQAENADYKTDSSLCPTSDKTTFSTSPSHPTKQRYNSIGKDTWNKSYQALTWDFNIPNDGYYRIAIKSRQNENPGFYSNRKILIDGKVPYNELTAQKFHYEKDWYIKNLTDNSDNDVYIYLKAGKHTITIQVPPSDIGKIIRRLDDIVMSVNNSTEFSDTVPIDLFTDVIAELHNLKSKIETISNYAGLSATPIDRLINLLEQYSDNPNTLLSDKQNLQNTLLSVLEWGLVHKNQPLELDYIEIATVHEEFSMIDKNYFEQLIFDFNSFIGLFFTSYTTLSPDTSRINVWVDGSREQALLIKELTGNAFGIYASINLTKGSIAEAAFAGNAPDAVLFLDKNSISMLAKRGLIYNFYDFDDYQNSLGERFSENQKTPYLHDSGLYALPLTNFTPTAFYRTDISRKENELNLKTLLLNSQNNSLLNLLKTGEVIISDQSFNQIISNNTPEINGLWDSVEIPITDENRELFNSIDDDFSSGAVIFHNSDRKNQSWDFIKWFITEETQNLYKIMEPSSNIPLNKVD